MKWLIRLLCRNIQASNCDLLHRVQNETQILEETGFTRIVKSGDHYVPRINIGLNDESCYVPFKNEYSLLKNVIIFAYCTLHFSKATISEVSATLLCL
jgi:hypothetical protein